MTDADLEGKFRTLAEPVLGARRVGRLLQACWALGSAPDVSTFISEARP
jgi:hypothetical protein